MLIGFEPRFRVRLFYLPLDIQPTARARSFGLRTTIIFIGHLTSKKMPDSLLFNQPQEIIRHAGEEHGAFAEYAIWVGCVLVILFALYLINSWRNSANEKKRLQEVVITHLDRVADAQERTEKRLWEELDRRLDNRGKASQGEDS